MKLIIKECTKEIIFRTTIKENKDIKKLIEHILINLSYSDYNFIKGLID